MGSLQCRGHRGNTPRLWGRARPSHLGEAGLRRGSVSLWSLSLVPGSDGLPLRRIDFAWIMVGPPRPSCGDAAAGVFPAEPHSRIFNWTFAFCPPICRAFSPHLGAFFISSSLLLGLRPTVLPLLGRWAGHPSDGSRVCGGLRATSAWGSRAAFPDLCCGSCTLLSTVCSPSGLCWLLGAGGSIRKREKAPCAPGMHTGPIILVDRAPGHCAVGIGERPLAPWWLHSSVTPTGLRGWQAQRPAQASALHLPRSKTQSASRRKPCFYGRGLVSRRVPLPLPTPPPPPHPPGSEDFPVESLKQNPCRNGSELSDHFLSLFLLPFCFLNRTCRDLQLMGEGTELSLNEPHLALIWSLQVAVWSVRPGPRTGAVSLAGASSRALCV